MSMLDKEIKICIDHVGSTNTRYTVIGDFIAKCLLVRICSKYEIAISEMVRLRMETMTNEAFCNKMENVLSRFSLLSSELEEKILKKFGSEYAKKFNNELDSDLRREYDNLVKNRHSVAHGRDIAFTIDDVYEAHQHGKLVLDAFAKALECDSSTSGS